MIFICLIRKEIIHFFRNKFNVATMFIFPIVLIVVMGFSFSNQVVEAINEVENIDVVDISKENYEMLIISHQIQMVVIIEENFSDNILNLEESEVTIKSISNSDVKETLVSIIKSKVNNLSLIAKISDKNRDKLKKIMRSIKRIYSTIL